MLRTFIIPQALAPKTRHDDERTPGADFQTIGRARGAMPGRAVAQIRERHGPGVGVLIPRHDEGAGLLASPVGRPIHVILFVAGLHVTHVLVPHADPPGIVRVRELRADKGGVAPLAEHGPLDAAEAQAILIARDQRPVQPHLLQPRLKERLIMGPVVVIAVGTQHGEMLTQNAIDVAEVHPGDVGLFFIAEITRDREQVRPFGPHQIEDLLKIGVERWRVMRVIAGIPDEGHFERLRPRLVGQPGPKRPQGACPWSTAA